MMSSKNISNKRSILFVVSTPVVIDFFMLNILKSLKKNYTITIVCNQKLDEHTFHKLKNMFFIKHIPINRNIKIFNDLYCLILLLQYLIFNRYDVIHAITPKAGLLTMIAGFFSMHKIRVYTFQGQVWFSKKGFYKYILKFCDLLISKISSHLLFVSNDEINFLLKEKIINYKQNIKLIKNGSICGIDLNRFTTRKKDPLLSKLINDRFTFIFLGRIHEDKGIELLINAFITFSSKFPSNLLIVGPDEANKKYTNYNKSNIFIFPKTQFPEKFLNLSDCLILPSLREAYGMVVLEAASFGIPSIGSNIYGLRECIHNKSTGLLFKSNSKKSLIGRMKKIYLEDSFRLELGRNAKKRVVENFNQNFYIDFYMNYYRTLINNI
jgi:glycosyltransferase involved in cell wall biosynthesis